jgi:hypothetical protein
MSALGQKRPSVVESIRALSASISFARALEILFTSVSE